MEYELYINESLVISDENIEKIFAHLRNLIKQDRLSSSTDIQILINDIEDEE